MKDIVATVLSHEYPFCLNDIQFQLTLSNYEYSLCNIHTDLKLTNSVRMEMPSAFDLVFQTISWLLWRGFLIIKQCENVHRRIGWRWFAERFDRACRVPWRTGTGAATGRGRLGRWFELAQTSATSSAPVATNSPSGDLRGGSIWAAHPAQV